MWVLLLVSLVDGGMGPTKFTTQRFTTQEQCLTAQHKAETSTVFGYCTHKEPKP